jgi:choline dehydrogenase-like flavoprotein
VTIGNRYDVIIIGTGAGGGMLAYHLAPSGQRILILELRSIAASSVLRPGCVTARRSLP